MTIDELKELAKLAHQPTGDLYLDDLFSRVSSAVYYRFLYHLVKIIQPVLVVELGMWRGGSTAHLAAPKSDCRVVSVDPDPQPEATGVIERYGNIEFIRDVSTSPKVLDLIVQRSVDLLYVDTEHHYYQLMAEHKAWLPKMKVGGVMCFDDITLSPSMQDAWTECVELHGEENCISMSDLHHSGFGAIIIKP